MRTLRPLPAALGAHFSTPEAARAGVGRSRRDGSDLARPFRGARATTAPETFRGHVDAYRPLLRPGQRFSGRTALRLWGLPLPGFWTADEPLEIAVAPDAAPPRRAGIQGHRVAPHRVIEWHLAGVPVIDPIAALFTIAARLDLTSTVILIDALVTVASDYPGRVPQHPPVTIDEVHDRMLIWGRFPGCRTVRRALELARDGVESPKETTTRLLITSAGLPEPVIQHVVTAAGRFLARVDLSYPQWRIAIEYEGDGHRTDQKQWRRDIQRQRDLDDAGWIVIRLTQADLQHPAAFLARLRRAIATRSGV